MSKFSSSSSTTITESKQEERAVEKPAETQGAKPLSRTASSVVNPFSMQSTAKGHGTMLGTSYPGINLSGASLQGLATNRSTKFFGVSDFFGSASNPDEGLSRHSVAPTAVPDEGSSRHPDAPAAPLGDGASSGPAVAQDGENEVEEENDIDLDLKL
ncbi:hypothetical protein ACET3Z_016589 [Daucus carota]